MDNAPIGVLDSGLGGLTVWKELRRAMPAESLVYFGDGKNCPYGPKPAEEVIGYVDEAVRFLLDRRAKLIVVACNAATAAAIDHLRATYDVPFVGMEPAVKPAAMTTRSGVVGILATRNTLNGHLFRESVARYGDRVRILSAVGEGFVEIVEANEEDTPGAEMAVRRAIEPMLAAGADRIVLGCTHYPFLAPVMRQVIGDLDVELVDPAPAVERRVAHLLAEHGLEAEAGHRAEYAFFTAADEAYRRKLEAKSRQALTMI
ncbi:MAG: glutamate racemase [Rikenellaceae bacterium]|nr:glutamate racemase [Rikenellaceae bacterium]